MPERRDPSPDPAPERSPDPDDEPVDAELLDEGLADEGLLGGGPGGLGELFGGGAFDVSSLLDTAMSLQQQMASAQQELSGAVVTGESGGGAVRIEVTGGYEFLAVHITPEAVDPDDVEMLEDLVLAALHDASTRVNDLQAGSIPSLGGLPDLGEVLGLGGLGPEDGDWEGGGDGDMPDEGAGSGAAG